MGNPTDEFRKLTPAPEITDENREAFDVAKDYLVLKCESKTEEGFEKAWHTYMQDPYVKDLLKAMGNLRMNLKREVIEAVSLIQRSKPMEKEAEDAINTLSGGTAESVKKVLDEIDRNPPFYTRIVRKSEKVKKSKKGRKRVDELIAAARKRSDVKELIWEENNPEKAAKKKDKNAKKAQEAADKQAKKRQKESEKARKAVNRKRKWDELKRDWKKKIEEAMDAAGKKIDSAVEGAKEKLNKNP